jgi:hypothetical protein
MPDYVYRDWLLEQGWEESDIIDTEEAFTHCYEFYWEGERQYYDETGEGFGYHIFGDISDASMNDEWGYIWDESYYGHGDADFYRGNGNAIGNGFVLWDAGEAATGNGTYNISD